MKKRERGAEARPRAFSVWTIECRDKFGRLKWRESNLKNTFHNDGQQLLLQIAFTKEQSVPTNYYVGLDARSSVVEADTLSNLSGEPSGNNYSRQACAAGATDFTCSKVGNDYRVTTKTVTFSATGSAWPAVTKLFLCTAASGTSGALVCTVALSASRTLQPGDSLNASCYLSLPVGT